MAHWLANEPRRRRRGRRRHRYNDPAHSRRRRRYGRRHRRNPVGIAQVWNRPQEYLMQAAFGLGGAYGVVIGGNFVGSFFPAMYQDPTVTGKVVRALTRGAVAYGVGMLTRGMDATNRAALQVGAAVGIVGGFVLDLLGASFALGAGDQTQTVAGILQPVGLVGTGTYMPIRRGAQVLAGTGAYARNRPGSNVISGIGEYGMRGFGMEDALIYTKMR